MIGKFCFQPNRQRFGFSDMQMRSLVHARANPYYLMLWLALLGSSLVFFFLLLVFSTRIRAEDWQGFPLPQAFVFSTITISLSSFSLLLANRSFFREDYGSAYRWHCITFSLAVAFCLLQVAGWARLNELGIEFRQISGAFLYILSGLHFTHILFGILGLGWILIDSYRYQSYLEGFIQSLNPIKLTRLRLFTVFWHFVGVLWIVLFIILKVNYG